MISQLPANHPTRVALEAEQKVERDLSAGIAAKQSELAKLRERHKEWLKATTANPEDIESTAMLDIPVRPSTEELANIEYEIRVLQTRRESQQQRISAARSRFTRATCELNRPAYIALQRRIHTALKQLAEANEAEVLFFEALADAGCRGGILRPMRVGEVGVANDPHGRLEMHRRELAEFLPEAL